MPVDIFLSYARTDDAEDGGISALRQVLQAEISKRLGKDVVIFQDTGIRAGDRWRVAVADGLSGSLVMVCIVTPLFLASEECRGEFDAFTRDKDRQRRANIVVPLYYLTTEFIEHSDAPHIRDVDGARMRAQRDFATRLLDRQLRDIRSLRTVPPLELLSHERTRELVHRVARDISEHMRQAGERRQPVLVVDQERGPYRSISAALERAEPGATIMVSGGLYEESLVFDKPVRLVGEGSPRRTILTAVGAPNITATAEFCVIENVSVRAQPDSSSHAIVAAGGRLELARCNIGGSAYACVVANTGAELRMWACRVHGSHQSGILIHGGTAWISHCRIYRNQHLGVLVERTGVAYISENVIRHCRVGIQYTDGASGTAVRNRISRNQFAGMHISSGADPVVVHNRIQYNDASGHRDVCGGILVYRFGHADRPGRGRILHNLIRWNSGAGIEIKDGASPVLYRNVVEGNIVGLWAHLGARGVVVRNTFVGNRDNLRIEGADPTLTANTSS